MLQCIDVNWMYGLVVFNIWLIVMGGLGAGLLQAGRLWGEHRDTQRQIYECGFQAFTSSGEGTREPSFMYLGWLFLLLDLELICLIPLVSVPCLGVMELWCFATFLTWLYVVDLDGTP